jgi:hypothetical protein
MHSPDLYFVDIENKDCQIISAKEHHAYKDVEMHRTVLMIKDENFRNPLILDVFRVDAENENQYDMPLWFTGHLLSTDFDYEAEMTGLKTLGEGHGYQHLWKEAAGKSEDESIQMTWFGNRRFYTLTSAVSASDDLIFARGGANDPEFNLRHDPVFIQRRKANSTVFFNIIESHGRYNPVSEIPLSPFSGIDKAEILLDTDAYTVVRLRHKTGKTWLLAIANQDADNGRRHNDKLERCLSSFKQIKN